MAKWYEWGEGDAVVTLLTDSMELYGSRLTEERGEHTTRDAAVSYHQYIMGLSTDTVEELTYPACKRVHILIGNQTGAWGNRSPQLVEADARTSSGVRIALYPFPISIT